MAPQPTSAPATETPTHPVGSPAWLVEQAKSLEKEKGALLERIGANRSLLRQMHKVGALDADMKRFVEHFYPEKGKDGARTDEAIEATRKIRAEARKG